MSWIKGEFKSCGESNRFGEDGGSSSIGNSMESFT